MSESNYGGRQPNNTAYIKNFMFGQPANLWRVINYPKSDYESTSVLTPSPMYSSLYIPGDIFIDGSIITSSDAILKKNINPLKIVTTEKLMNLKPCSFEFNNDIMNHIHYGFIANELETEYPELVHTKPDNDKFNIKSVNYLEIIPLLVHKIQIMQKEIDELKSMINS